MRGGDSFGELLARLGVGLADFIIFIARLSQSPVWQGVFVDFTIKMDKDEVTVPHGLGRVHRGAFIVFSDEAYPVYVDPPENDKQITFFMGELAPEDLSFRAWVFG